MYFQVDIFSDSQKTPSNKVRFSKNAEISHLPCRLLYSKAHNDHYFHIEVVVSYSVNATDSMLVSRAVVREMASDQQQQCH